MTGIVHPQQGAFGSAHRRPIPRVGERCLPALGEGRKESPRGAVLASPRGSQTWSPLDVRYHLQALGLGQQCPRGVVLASPWGELLASSKKEMTNLAEVNLAGTKEAEAHASKQMEPHVLPYARTCKLCKINGRFFGIVKMVNAESSHV